MSCRRRVYATVVTVAAFFFCCVWVVTGRAWAGDNEDARVMLFSGRDIWRNGIFVYGGLVFAPGGLEQDGLLLKVLLSGGAYRYRAETSAASASPASRLSRNCCPAGGSNVATWN
ncbi:MAG: cellulose biosynthesis protein BcsS [Pseudolabrys sp.]